MPIRPGKWSPALEATGPHLGESLDVLLVQRGQALLHQPHVVVACEGLAVLGHQAAELRGVVGGVHLR